jgi:hypothetical protein
MGQLLWDGYGADALGRPWARAQLPLRPMPGADTEHDAGQAR